MNNIEISIGSANSNHISGNTTPSEIIADIKNGKWADDVASVRAAVSHYEQIVQAADQQAIKDADEEIKRLKKRLPAVLWTGIFTSRKNEGIERFSGYLCADIDKVPDRISEIQEIARTDQHVVAAFVSPSGRGIKIVFLVPVAANAREHRQNFNAVRTHVASHYKAQVDEAAKDVARLCFVSHDPDAIYNAAAVPLDMHGPATVSSSVPHLNGVEIGNRNNSAFNLACDFRDLGQTPAETQAAVRDFASKCNPPLPEAEADSCVKSAFRQPPRPIAKPPVGKSLGELKRRTADDPNELLKNGYLCRGGGLLIIGPTGIGKSSYAMQAMILWALGRACFGITPTRPLKSLLIQAEDDDGDLAEMRDGIIAGLNLTDEEKQVAFANCIVVQENTRTLRVFMDSTVAPLLELHQPDLLWINPALSYIGSNANAQEAVSFFLRNLLNPLLTKHNCGCVVIHHTNKPTRGEEKSQWQAGDFAYLGSGSAEWANWARAVLAIRSVGSHNVFELRAGKRGARIGWIDGDGKTSFARLIGHSTEPGVIFWRDADASEVPVGKAKRPGTREDLLALVPFDQPIVKNLLIDLWKDRHGNKDKGRAHLDALIKDEKLFVWSFKRSGTNAEKQIARRPQPKL